MFFVGHLYDTWGRRYTLLVTLGGVCLGLCLTPLVAPSLFALILVQTLMSICLNGPYSSPLIADYLKKSARGKGSAVQSLGYIFGAMFTNAIVFNATKNLDYN